MQGASGPGAPLAEDESVYRTDEFRMESMKVLPCSKRFVHDWTDCPFAHPQEKARRRDPRVHTYTGIACPSMKKEGCCAFGDHCPYAHNVFEYWLHPTRYRTQLCNDGSNCKRKICFFAHSLDELRVPACKPFVSPEALAAAAAAAAADAEAKRKAATVGSPLSAFAAMSPGPSPQRSSLDALRGAGSAAAAAAADARASGSSLAGPLSPSPADAAAMGSSPADAAVHAALAQLTGAGFSAKDQQVIELVTSLLAQDRVSPEQAATILQQMLPPGALSTLQARLNTPRGSAEAAAEAAGPRADHAASPRDAASALMGAGAPGLEHLAAMQAAQTMGLANAFPGGAAVYPGAHPGHGLLGLDPTRRMSLESARSSFDTARMSFERGSLDVGTPRGSVEACYPANLHPAGSLPTQGWYGGQLSTVPEQFPMINAPPPASWGAGRYSESAADRLSQDLQRMSFEAASAPGMLAPQTANPYASSFFASGTMPSTAAQRLSAPLPGELRGLALPASPGGRSFSLPATAEEEEAAAAHHQLLQRLQQQ